MITRILSIIGIVALIWLLVLFIAHIIEAIVFKFTDDAKWVSISRSTSIYGTELGEWYIIPTISLYFDVYGHRYPAFQIIWLKWIFNISYHFKTQFDEEAEAEARYILRKEKGEL